MEWRKKCRDFQLSSVDDISYLMQMMRTWIQWRSGTIYRGGVDSYPSKSHLFLNSAFATATEINRSVQYSESVRQLWNRKKLVRKRIHSLGANIADQYWDFSDGSQALKAQDFRPPKKIPHCSHLHLQTNFSLNLFKIKTVGIMALSSL
jgi:hypothetical protein